MLLRPPSILPLLACFFLFGLTDTLAGQPSSPVLPSYNREPRAPEVSGMDANARELAAKMGLGWNLGNTLEATGGETGWGNPKVTPELLDLIKANGFTAIRLPVSWHRHADPVTAEISADWLARVHEIVAQCVERDLYVVLNIHWDGGWLERHVEPEHQEAVAARQRAYWEQIATAFREFDEHVLFASANEPHVETAEQMAVLLAYHQTFVEAVRSTGGRNAYRVLIVQGPSTDITKAYRMMHQLPVDTIADRLMVELHFYTPYEFALLDQLEDGLRPAYFWGKANLSPDQPELNPTWGDEAELARLFGMTKAQFVDRGIPVILGEYGAILRGYLTGEMLQRHRDSRATYLYEVTRLCRESGFVPFYWDCGKLGTGGFAIFDRRQLKVHDAQALEALQAGMRETAPAK